MALSSLTIDINLGLAKLEADSGKAAQIINRDAQKMAVATEKADAAVRRLTQAYTQVGVEAKVVAAAAAGASDSALKLFAGVAAGAGAFATVGANGVAAFKAIGASSEDATKAAEARILLLAEKVRQVKDQAAGLTKEAVVGRETGKFDDDSLKKRLADIRAVEKAELQRIADVASADAAARRAAVAERLNAAKGAAQALATIGAAKAGAQATVFLGVAAAQEEQAIADQRIADARRLVDVQNGLTATYRAQLQALRELRDAGSITSAQFKQAGSELVARQPAVQQRVAKVDADTAYLANLEREASVIGKTRSEVVALDLARRGLTAQGASYVAALKAAEEKTGQFGKSAFASRNQLLTLQYTISDVIASAGSGISPLTILLQQGGQVFDAFGGANAQGKGGFFKNFIGSIASLVTPARLAIGGLAAAGGLVATALFKGAEQSKAFADAVVLSGNFAGQTAGKFEAQVKAIAGTGEVSASAAREIGQALLATGQIGPQVFAKTQEAAARYAQATGKNAKEVAEIFAGLAQDPAKAAAELNKTLNFLSASQLQMIRTLQEGGRANEAQAIAVDALSSRLKQLEPNLGTLDRALRATTNLWGRFWNAAFDIGRPETLEDKIAKTQRAIDSLRLRPPGKAEADLGAAVFGSQFGGQAGIPDTSRALSKEQATKDGLLREQQQQTQAAFFAATAAETNKAAAAADDYYRAAGKGAKLQTALTRELAEEEAKYQAAVKKKASDPDFDLISDADRKAVQKKIRDSYVDKSGVNSANDQRKALLDRDLKLLQDQLAREQDTLKFNQADLQAIYSASNISLKQFYDEKERLTAEGVERQLVFLRGQRARNQADLDRNQFKDPADRTKAETQRNEATEKITDLEREAANAAKLAARERTAAFKALNDQIAEYNANLLQLAGDEAGAAKARADVAIENAKLFDERAGGAISQGQLDRQVFLIVQAKEFAEVQRRTGVVSADAARSEETFLLRAAQRGADLQETERGVFQLRSAALEQLGRLTQEAQALAAASTDPKIVQFAKDLELQYARAADAIDPAVLRLREAGKELSGGIANSLNQTSTNFSSLYGARLDTAAKDAAGRRDGLNKEIKDLQDTLGKTTNNLDRRRLNDRIVSLQRELASVKEESRFDVLLKTFERDVLKPLVQQAASSIQKVLITDPLQKYIEAQLRGLTENGGALASFFSDISGSRGLNVDKSGLGIDTKGFSQAQDSAAAFELVTTSATAAVSAQDLQIAAVTNSTTAVTSLAAAAELAAQALNRISISAGGSGFNFSGGSEFGTGSGFGNQDLGAFLADGTNYVPYDGFRATLHKGESVTPAKYNPAAGGGGNGGNVYITNNAPAEVSAERDSNGDFQVLIEAAANRAHQLVAADHSSGTGPSSRALKSRGVNLNSSLARRG